MAQLHGMANITESDLAGIHPAADLLPMMSEDEFQALCDDAEANGFIESVQITGDRLVLDGRNRLAASIAIALDVHITKFNPVDPISHVLGKNVFRRHLSVGQKAAIGLKAEKMYAEQAKEEQRKAGKNLVGVKKKSL